VPGRAEGKINSAELEQQITDLRNRIVALEQAATTSRIIGLALLDWTQARRAYIHCRENDQEPEGRS